MSDFWDSWGMTSRFADKLRQDANDAPMREAGGWLSVKDGISPSMAGSFDVTHLFFSYFFEVLAYLGSPQPWTFQMPIREVTVFPHLPVEGY